MTNCSSDEDCSNHGVCDSNKCICDLGWFSSDCTQSGAEVWGAYWSLFRILFAVAFLLLAAYAMKELVEGMMLRTSLGWARIAVRLVRSPKNLSMGLIVIAATLRGVWLCIDPLSLSGVTNHLTDRLLYDTVFPTMYCVYCSVLLVWSGLYHAITSGKQDWSKGIRISILVFMGTSFVISIAFSVCQGTRVKSGSFIIPGLIFVSIAVGSIIAGLCFFGSLFNKYIKRTESNYDESSEEDYESRSYLKPAYEYEQEIVSDEFQRTGSVQVTTGFSKANTENEAALVLIRNQSLPPGVVHHSSSVASSTAQLNDDFNEEWSVSEVSVSVTAADMALHSWSRFNSSMHIPLPLKARPPFQPASADPKEKERYIVMMSYQDKMILRQIIILTTLSAVIGVMVIGLTVLIAGNKVVKESKLVLGLLFLASGMEFFAYIVVLIIQALLIFSTHIKVKSKENLHFVSEVTAQVDSYEDSEKPWEVSPSTAVSSHEKAAKRIHLSVATDLNPVK